MSFGMNCGSYYAGFYWGPRKETLDEVAVRAESFLACISKVDPLFCSFRVTADDKRAASKAPNKSRDLRSLLAKGGNRTDIGRKVIPELGYTLSLWNEEDDGSYVSLRIICGGYSKWNTNICVVHLPSRGLASERLLSVPVLSQLCMCSVKSWHPDAGLVTTLDLDDSSSQQDDLFEVGWITYLPSGLPLSPLPKPARFEPITGFGGLLIATDEKFSTQKREHMKVIRQLKSLFMV